MLQLLSMGRLGKANVLPAQATTKAAAYQALALAEGFGPFLPNGWRVDRATSHREIISAVRWLLSREGEEHTNVLLAAWYNERVIGVPLDVLQNAQNMTIEQAIILLEGLAIAMPSNNMWLNGLSFITTGLTSLCRRGTISEDHRNKIIQGVKNATAGHSVNMTIATVKRFYATYGTNLNAENAGELMDHLTAIVPDNVIALRNVLLQFAGSGLTTYMTILRAFQSFEDFSWQRLSVIAPVDFANMNTAIDTVGTNLYFGFNHQMAAASSKRFPSLAYASFQLCIKAGGDQALRNYQGMPLLIPRKAQIDQLIADYVAARVQNLASLAVDPAVAERINAIHAAGVVVYNRMMNPAAPAPPVGPGQGGA